LNWRIVPSAGFVYRNRKWTAADGFLQYPVSGLWTGDEPKQEVHGPVISYEQALWFPVITLKAGYTLKNCFLFSAGGSLYPVMWGDTIDNHLLRSEQLCTMAPCEVTKFPIAHHKWKAYTTVQDVWNDPVCT
jgi:outer membrane protease